PVSSTLSLHDALPIFHLYAYSGFPRSIRGLQTFMSVLEDRKERGITDELGPEASPIAAEGSRYQRGKKILEELLQKPLEGPQTGDRKSTRLNSSHVKI